MTNITISLPEDSVLKLREIATRLSVSPEALARASVEELLTRPDETFRAAVGYILKKNAELYRRLAECAISLSMKFLNYICGLLLSQCYWNKFNCLQASSSGSS
jgi:hypothetical protein